MRLSSWPAAACLAGFLGLLAACDSAPGPEALGLRPPTLSDFSFSPRSVVLEQWPAELIDGDNVLVPLELRVTVRDPDSAIDEVRFVVQSPLSSFEPVATGLLSTSGADAYAAAETITLPRGAVGTYTIVVFAVDADRKLSGEVRGTLTYVATGRPPVIEAVETPETVTRPAPGAPPVVFQYVAVVSDPDGLDNVAKVEVEIENTGTLRLCDDGGMGACNTGFPDSGDADAGDGRFTLTLQIDSNNEPATLTLRFKATDRTGLESAIVERTFTIL